MHSTPGIVVARRLRMIAGLAMFAELVVFLLAVRWLGLGWTLLALLATTGIGWLLLARQGTRALRDLRDRARSGRPAGRELGDAGLVAVGGLLMVLPGFLGDLVGLTCLLPFTRPLPRALLGRTIAARLPAHVGGPVRVRSSRTEWVEGTATSGPPLYADSTVVTGEGTTGRPGDRPVIEGAVVGEQDALDPEARDRRPPGTGS